jgi:hypothetical protein
MMQHHARKPSEASAAVVKRLRGGLLFLLGRRVCERLDGELSMVVVRCRRFRSLIFVHRAGNNGYWRLNRRVTSDSRNSTNCNVNIAS